MKELLHSITFRRTGKTPVYEQIYRSIKRLVEKGILTDQTTFPSTAEFCKALQISKNTYERTARLLKSNGFLKSIPGKGYFLTSSEARSNKIKILLLFDHLTVYKKIIYDALMEKAKSYSNIDFYLHNNDILRLNHILAAKERQYDKLIIIPPLEHDMLFLQILHRIPSKKLYILERPLKDITQTYKAVYQDVKEDIFQAMELLKLKLQSYQSVTVLFSSNSLYPKDIVIAICTFCRNNQISYSVLPAVEKVVPGHVYVTISDEDFTLIVEKIGNSSLQLGKEIGLISYNETSLKKFVLNGITTISSDYRDMGYQMAALLISEKMEALKVPCRTICRNSL